MGGSDGDHRNLRGLVLLVYDAISLLTYYSDTLLDDGEPALETE